MFTLAHSFKYAVYKNLGHFETIDQIRAGRFVNMSCDTHMMVT